MKHWRRGLWVGLASGLLVGCADPPAARAPARIVSREPEVVWKESFDGAAPVGWVSPSRASAEVVAQVYSLDGDGPERELSAFHDASSSSAAPAVHWGMAWQDNPIPLSSACHLSWRWRVEQHPTVDANPWLDVAVSVYVVMSQPGLFSKGKGFKFGWLAKPGPANTSQRGLLQVALRTDPASDAWQHEHVDLCRLYAAHFGDPENEKLVYIGVVTDADDTKSTARGSYDDFVLSTAPMPSSNEETKP